ncbi:MAG: precorrin-8X methylmutase [Desulfamplus sp.]|nr:precorrin-8X methylmutase [Desulfamplus sp.]
MQPQDIEKLSFKIIDQEAGDHGFKSKEWPIVQRMIHTSADFEYINTVRFHPEAISAGMEAIRNGCTVITDTNMARAGIRKSEISMFGGEIKCLIGDEDVARRAKQEGITRALAAVDKSALITGSDTNRNIIYVVGNAPTALLRIIELLKEGRIKPALIIGLPVGFVNAAESKDELMRLDWPYISNTGRKGGSNLAASVVNALAIMASES